MADKKRAGLGVNSHEQIKGANEANEANSTQKTGSKQKPRTAKVQQQDEIIEASVEETIEIPEIETTKRDNVKIKKVPEIQTKEVQELQDFQALQEGTHEQIESAETLDLIETIDHIRLEAFLKADPLYRQYKAAQLPKYQRLDVKLYVLLRDDQLEFLARLTRQIMKNRTSDYKIERITKNTIIRALIDNLKELELDVRNIPDETELAKRIADSIRSVRLASLSGEQGT